MMAAQYEDPVCPRGRGYLHCNCGDDILGNDAVDLRIGKARISATRVACVEDDRVVGTERTAYETGPIAEVMNVDAQSQPVGEAHGTAADKLLALVVDEVDDTAVQLGHVE